MLGFRRKRLVRLNMRDDLPAVEAIDGLLLGIEADHYHLVNASHVVTTEQAQPVGEVWVPCKWVAYVQRLG